MNDIYKDTDGKTRCHWCSLAPEFPAYHDREWGYPVDDDIRLFEKLCLESFQSGLSWRTILVKRDNFRNAFDGFDFHKIALYGSKDVERLLNDTGIVRHRGKIDAVINNASRAVEMCNQHGSLAAFFWAHELKDPAHEPQTVSKCAESEALSKTLKKMGWKFVGPTTVYSFMQAMGLVNDHSEGCFTREEVRQAREGFTPPV